MQLPLTLVARISATKFATCAGSISGVDLSFAESLRHAMIDPVKVTAPMKTPMNTSA